jgi:hypothetical protein
MFETVDIWHGFWSTAATAAAILLGFSLVSIAVRAKESVSGENPRSLHGLYPAMGAYAAVLMIGLLTSMPMLTPRRLGLVVAAVGAVLVVGSSWKIASTPRGQDKIVGTLPFGLAELAIWICYVIVLWSGIKLMRGAVHAINWLAVAGWLLLASAILTTFRSLRKMSA